MPIEPSLLAMSTEHAYAHAPQPTVPVLPINGAVDGDTAQTKAAQKKIERRKQLSREAAAMREMLWAKERELADLEDEGEAETGEETQGDMVGEG